MADPIAQAGAARLHTHDWSDDVIDRPLDATQRPEASDDAFAHLLLKEMS